MVSAYTRVIMMPEKVLSLVDVTNSEKLEKICHIWRFTPMIHARIFPSTCSDRFQSGGRQHPQDRASGTQFVLKLESNGISACKPIK